MLLNRDTLSAKSDDFFSLLSAAILAASDALVYSDV